MTISAVLLDVGGVFVLPDVTEIMAVVRAYAPAATEEQLTRGHYYGVAAMDRAATTKGVTADWRAYNRAVVGQLGIPSELAAEVADKLATAMGSVAWNRVIPGSIEALQALAARGLALAVVSNSNGTVEAQLIECGICQVGPGQGVPVAAVLDSFTVGVEKPQPAIFEQALAVLGVSPEQAVHVGDTGWADVAGARGVGIRPVHVDPYGLCPDVDEHAHVVHISEVLAVIDSI